MITKESLDKLIKELFPDKKITPFSMDWILNNPKATEDSVREVYRFLSNMGVANDRIASHADLLGRDPQTIKRNYQELLALGLKKNRIGYHLELLGRDPQTIKRNYQELLALGLKKNRVGYHLELLGGDPQTIKRNYQELLALGLKKNRVGYHLDLLGRDPQTIKRNYQNHIGLLKQNYQDRTSGRKILTNQPQLLGISPETINANVQFLSSLGIDYHNAPLLGSRPQLKREKMAWMLRELFDYRTLSQEQRRDAINDLYDFIRDYPKILTKSINSIRRSKDKLLKRVVQYRR